MTSLNVDSQRALNIFRRRHSSARSPRNIMNSAIESLLEAIETDPLPSAHTSSYWKQYGQTMVVERQDNQLRLQARNLECVSRISLPMRILHRIERASYQSVTAKLRNYPDVWNAAKRLVRDLSASPNFNVLKSVCALAILVDHWQAHGISPKTFALIGDGYGFLGALVHRWDRRARLYCIDLPKTLIFQARTHEIADSGVSMATMISGHSISDATVTFVAPQCAEEIGDEIDCAISIASMQEMTASSIAAYFTFLRHRSRAQSRFYCVNRMKKELPGGEVTSFADYPWHEADEVFIDGVCPHYTHFVAPYTSPNGPRVLGIRIPFFNYFDGIHLHRLARLAPL